MTDYIKVPTALTQDLLRSIEAPSPSSRINAKQTRSDDYPDYAVDADKEKKNQNTRHFLTLRDLIDALQGSAQINKVDLVTAEAEMQNLGLAIVEDQLIPNLLQLKIPPASSDHLLPQIDNNPSRIRHTRDRRIGSQGSPLFLISTAGLWEYNLRIEKLTIAPGKFCQQIVDEIEQEGLCVKQQKRLRLTFSRSGMASGVETELLNLQISVLLGVMESDEADRRAILYPQADQSYGLYADKRINFII